jgi:hypothetical protein
MPARKSAPVLTIVAPANEGVAASSPTAADRIRHLREEARALAHEHIEVLRGNLEDTALLAREIAQGGEAYPVGARELARRMADELSRTASTLNAILARN